MDDHDIIITDSRDPHHRQIKLLEEEWRAEEQAELADLLRLIEIHNTISHVVRARLLSRIAK